MNRNSKFSLLIVGLLLAASQAQAAAPDFSTLTGAVDLSTVGTAILAVAALMVAPKVIAWGARRVMGFIR